MKYLQLTLPTPAENLALDEALLAQAESSGVETLRIWESRTPFVVLGLSNRVHQEVRLTECAVRGIPILRRCSGGGTVVQGPGCLSYALTLRIDGAGPTGSITASNQFIMERHRRALATTTGRPMAVRGHTDLETDGRKFSGNAQRRGHSALLFHGTILYAADLELIGALLQHPSREPDWRLRRTHRDFMGNLPLRRESIADSLRQAWSADVPADPILLTERLAVLAARHTDPAWIHRLP